MGGGATDFLDADGGVATDANEDAGTDASADGGDSGEDAGAIESSDDGDSGDAGVSDGGVIAGVDDGTGGAGGSDAGSGDGGAEGSDGGGGEAGFGEPTVTTTATFYSHFKDCMGASGLPAPDSLFGTITAATATIGAIQKAVTAYGTEVTIAELIGAGALADGLAVVGALTASFYVGACIGCLGAAGVEWITD
jgi:hypothetical protein